MICIPIMGKTTTAIKAIEKSAPHCDMIELRMDLIPQGNVKELIKASRTVSPSLKILVTNRSVPQSGKALPEKRARHAGQDIKTEKGVTYDDEKHRIDVLKEAVILSCNYVDCELETAKKLRNELLSTIRAHKNRTKLIISDHHFQATPSLSVLKKLFRDCVAAKADIVKIITYARQVEDNLRILELVAYARKEGQDVAAFCMGAHGTVSRVVAPLLGSCITYASLQRGLESAPGQLTVKEIKDIFRILNVKSL